MKNLAYLFLFSITFGLIGCQPGEDATKAETVYINGPIYTVAANEMAEAVAVSEGKIIYVGNKDGLQEYIGEDTKTIDLAGKTMTPGFIESHGHLMGLGQNELNLDLMGIKSYDEMIEMVAAAVAEAEPGEWILGRGWHQSKWDKMPEEMVKGFQTHDRLSAVSPENPVFLRHASGHAAFANAKAMEIAGVNQMSIESLTQDLEGGEVIRDENGNPTGLFSERAAYLIAKYVPEEDNERADLALELAIKACQRNGITSFHDAGVSMKTIEVYKRNLEQGKLKMRLYPMLSGSDRKLLEHYFKNGPEIGLGNDFLTIRSIKLYSDGALGSRGAWLLEPYSDMPGESGHSTTPIKDIYLVCETALEQGFQVCTHAIGDRANREVLDQ